MRAKLKISQVFIYLLLAFFIFPSSGFAGPHLQVSTALQTILNQTETTYMQPLGLTMQNAINQDPDMFAGLVGMTLQRQYNYLGNHRDYLPQYQVLEEEALTFLHQLAKAHNYRHPADGSNLPEARMGVEFYSGLKGDSNGYFMQKFGIDPANAGLPFMLAQVSVPEKNGEDGGWLGKIQVKEGGITIFGETIGAAGQPSYPLPILSEDIIPEDIIIGTWAPKEDWEKYFSTRGHGPVTFSKQGNVYVGKFTYLDTGFSDFPNGIKITKTYTLDKSLAKETFGGKQIREYQTRYTSICTPYYNSGFCDKPGETSKGHMGVRYDTKKQRYSMPMLLGGGILGGYYKLH